MKIVIISDVHANYDALRALPEEFDELWVLGDIVNYGPEPAEVVERIMSQATLVVRGNHDQSIGTDEAPQWKSRYYDMAETSRQFTVSVLNDKHKEFLRGLPHTCNVVRDNTRFRLVHATPSDPLYGWCPADSPNWDIELESVQADIVLVGHTHVPFLRKIGEKLLVNPGSLGQPKTGAPDASYAVWKNSEIELRSFAYPVHATVEKLRALSFPPSVEKDLIDLLQTGVVEDRAMAV